MKSSTPLYLDPWQSAPRFAPRGADPLDVPPSNWSVLQSTPSKTIPGRNLAEIVGGAVCEALANGMPANTVGAHHVWSVVRRDRQIELALSTVPFAVPTEPILGALYTLHRAGDVLQALRARRDALDAMIQALEARRGEAAVAS